MTLPGQLDRKTEPIILRASKGTIRRQVTIHAAKTRPSRLIEAVLDGEEGVIARGGRPVVRLVPVRQRPSQVGLLAGRLGTIPDFLAPMDATELDLRDGRTGRRRSRPGVRTGLSR